METTVLLRKEEPEFLSKLETICKLCLMKRDLKTWKRLISKNWKRKMWANFHFVCTSGNGLELLRLCLIDHRFWEAAQILEHITPKQYPCTSGIHAKNSLYVLENLKDETTRDITEFFVRHVKVVKEINQRELILEYLMYRLRSLQFDFPTDVVQSVVSDYLSCRKNSVIDPLYDSYLTLYEYMVWAKAASSNSNGESHFMEGSQDTSEKIISSWSTVLVKPGVWDIFLEKLVQILLWKGEYKRCDGILKSYAETHPNHLNAYVYLELYRNEIDKAERKENLKKIADMSPSDQLVIDYVDTLLQDDELDEALNYMFLFMDYSVNKKCLRGWTTLVDILCEILQSREHKYLTALKHNWKERCTYWVRYHFDATYVDFKNKEESRLCVKKSLFLCVVLKSTDHLYIQRTCQNLSTSYPKRMRKLQRKIDVIESLNKIVF